LQKDEILGAFAPKITSFYTTPVLLIDVLFSIEHLLESTCSRKINETDLNSNMFIDKLARNTINVFHLQIGANKNATYVLFVLQ
jgi:hypothetical protein